MPLYRQSGDRDVNAPVDRPAVLVVHTGHFLAARRAEPLVCCVVRGDVAGGRAGAAAAPLRSVAPVDDVNQQNTGRNLLAVEGADGHGSRNPVAKKWLPLSRITLRR